jgi:hypothetical protein
VSSRSIDRSIKEPVIAGNLGRRLLGSPIPWFTGMVRHFNPGQRGRPGPINVDFPDGTNNVFVSFYITTGQSITSSLPSMIECEGGVGATVARPNNQQQQRPTVTRHAARALLPAPARIELTRKNKIVFRTPHPTYYFLKHHTPGGAAL